MTVTGYAFGPFRIDLRAHRLLRGDARIALSAHLLDVLAHLVARAGELVTREQLLETFWRDVFVTDNTITRAISDLRQALGDDPKEPRYIQTVARRGYRFVAPVKREASDTRAPDPTGARAAGDGCTPLGSAAAIGPDLQGLSDLVRSIPDLEAFDTGRLAVAHERLRRAVAKLPDYAPVHIALASAGALSFEADRHGPSASDALREAAWHARRACDLDTSLAEAWATLAFVLTIEGRDLEAARTAARKAVMMEPSGWRHHFRLAFASWGDERLRAVSKTLALVPGMPFACLTGAMVHVARGSLQAALELLEQASIVPHGAAAPSRLPAAGVDWLRGALLWSRGPDVSQTAALESANREIAAHEATRLYSTEFAVNAWHWRAGWSHRRGELDTAARELDRALALDPLHARSAVAAAAIACERVRPDAEALDRRAGDLVRGLEASGRLAEAAACAALRARLRGDAAEAVAILDALLTRSPIDHTGWTIPIDPWLDALRGRPDFGTLLRKLALRAV